MYKVSSFGTSTPQGSSIHLATSAYLAAVESEARELRPDRRPGQGPEAMSVTFAPSDGAAFDGKVKIGKLLGEGGFGESHTVHEQPPP